MDISIEASEMLNTFDKTEIREREFVQSLKIQFQVCSFSMDLFSRRRCSTTNAFPDSTES